MVSEGLPPLAVIIATVWDNYSTSKSEEESIHQINEILEYIKTNKEYDLEIKEYMEEARSNLENIINIINNIDNKMDKYHDANIEHFKNLNLKMNNVDDTISNNIQNMGNKIIKQTQNTVTNQLSEYLPFLIGSRCEKINLAIDYANKLTEQSQEGIQLNSSLTIDPVILASKILKLRRSNEDPNEYIKNIYLNNGSLEISEEEFKTFELFKEILKNLGDEIKYPIILKPNYPLINIRLEIGSTFYALENMIFKITEVQEDFITLSSNNRALNMSLSIPKPGKKIDPNYQKLNISLSFEGRPIYEIMSCINFLKELMIKEKIIFRVNDQIMNGNMKFEQKIEFKEEMLIKVLYQIEQEFAITLNLPKEITKRDLENIQYISNILNGVKNNNKQIDAVIPKKYIRDILKKYNSENTNELYTSITDRSIFGKNIPLSRYYYICDSFKIKNSENIEKQMQKGLEDIKIEFVADNDIIIRKRSIPLNNDTK
ncbi:hypothetical protein J2127_000996 [Methanococcus voltae]|uniref:hypothetical protein n=1 Tax=Methanococcus voltae TaxID=2188 RepID=UPI001AE785FC|nr:hypothetical protein [Methanococcus voltae]MBP2143828.1 hypothetical protein [Methanococcus voltae]